MVSETLLIEYSSWYKTFSAYKAVRETPWRSFVSHIKYHVLGNVHNARSESRSLKDHCHVIIAQQHKHTVSVTTHSIWLVLNAVLISLSYRVSHQNERQGGLNENDFWI